MKLSKIVIENFRALRKAEINVGSELALVGQNSSGKSSVLRALNAFFNYSKEREAFESGRHCFQKSATTIIELHFSGVPSTCSLPRIQLSGDEVRVRLRYKKAPVWQVFENGQWTRAPEALHEEIAPHVRYVFVPLRRDHEVSAWADGSLLKTAVDTWVTKHIERRDSISPKVSEITDLIQRRAFSGLGKELRNIVPIDGKFQFSLEYAQTPNYSLLLRDLVLRVSEGSTTVDLEDCGSGTQSMAAFALYSYLAKLEGSTYILGIEEPEQNLHPQAQRALLKNLRSSPLQVLFTTHSIVLLDQLEHEEVVLCRRIPSNTRGIEVTTTQLKADFWTQNSLDKDRYYQFYRRRNSEFFFANFVILTESPVDAELVKEILAKTDTAPVDYGVSVLSLDGVQSLPYAYCLLRALKVEFATIVDKDYFLPYLNDEAKKSLDARGFPRYQKRFQTNSLIHQIIADQTTRMTLLDLFFSNHSRAMDILETENVFCFRWSLEVDLVNSEKARDLLFAQLNVPQTERTTNALLEKRSKSLKKLETLLPVIKTLQPSNLPNSYKRLRKVLPPLIRRAASLS